ncbi:MAG TPA: hypothetical protein VNG51_16945 [Ktedonobacteraceae bacterium]|nr:hypothetical protein [Ktedonobacteraceae bacterium]
MKLVHAIFFGIFILIMLYLGLSNGSAATSILGSGSNALTSETKILQGR